MREESQSDKAFAAKNERGHEGEDETNSSLALDLDMMGSSKRSAIEQQAPMPPPVRPALPVEATSQEEEILPGAYGFANRVFRTADEVNANLPYGDYPASNLDLAVSNDHNTPGLVTADPVPDHDPFPRAEPDNPESKNATRRLRLATQALVCVFVGLLALVGSVVLYVKLQPHPDTNEKTREVEPSKEDYMLALLPQQTTHRIDPAYNATQTTSLSIVSPQTRAFHWSVHDPKFDTYADWQLVQRFALVCLFYSTGGEKTWHSRQNWLSYEIDEYNWYMQSMFETETSYLYGFSWFQGMNLFSFLEESNELSHLWLAENGIVDSLPPEMFLLTSLRSIDFSGNVNLTGTLPTEIGLMDQLRVLAVPETSLSGSLPSEIGMLESLVIFHAAKAKFQGTMPTQIGKLQTLILELGSAELTGSIPSELGLNVNPSLIYLSGNHLSSSIPSQLGLLSSSLFMDLADNMLTGPIPSELGNILQDPLTFVDKYIEVFETMFPDLDISYLFDNLLESALESAPTGLQLEGNFLTGSIPTEVGKFADVALISIHRNMLSGSLPSELGLLSGLSRLSLFDNQIQSIIPSQLGHLASLKEVLLHNNPLLSGPLPSELDALALNGSLVTMTIRLTAISGTIPEELCSLGMWDMSQREGLSFDCLGMLCGCDWCPCLE